MREGFPNQLTGVPSRKEQENDAIPQVAPKWLKYDRQVSAIFLASFLKMFIWLFKFIFLNLDEYLFNFNRSSYLMPSLLSQWLKTQMKISEWENVRSTITSMMIQSTSSSQRLRIQEFHKEFSLRDISYLTQMIIVNITHGETLILE